MFDIVKTLGQGYSTPDEALAPLMVARDSLSNIKGDLVFPESEVTYVYGRGRERMDLPVLVTIQKDEDGYSVKVRIDRVSRFWKFWIVAANGVFPVFCYLKGRLTVTEALLSFSVFGVLSYGLVILLSFKAAGEATKDLLWAYQGEEDNQSPQPTPPSRRG